VNRLIIQAFQAMAEFFVTMSESANVGTIARVQADETTLL